MEDCRQPDWERSRDKIKPKTNESKDRESHREKKKNPSTIVNAEKTQQNPKRNILNTWLPDGDEFDGILPGWWPWNWSSSSRSIVSVAAKRTWLFFDLLKTVTLLFSLWKLLIITQWIYGKDEEGPTRVQHGNGLSPVTEAAIHWPQGPIFYRCQLMAGLCSASPQIWIFLLFS